MVAIKKVEGFVEDVSQNTITLVNKKPIYIPEGKRELIRSLDFKIGEEVRLSYEMKGQQRGNLIDAERITRGEFETVPKTNEQDQKDIPLLPQPPEGGATGAAPVTGGSKGTDMHIQTPVLRQWIPENEREYRITLQSVLARAVEIVNAHYQSYPDILTGKDFIESLDARCNNIEWATDKLLEYVQSKIEHDKKPR